jgi:hypothetical protein
MGVYDAQINKAWHATVRTPSAPSGYLEAYNVRLGSGTTYATMVEELIGQGEVDSNVRPICRLYQAMFRRKPDTAGLDSWAASLVANRNALGNQTAAVQAVAAALATSAEFQAVYSPSSSNSTFVTILYEVVLGRSPDAGGLAAYTAALDSGSLTRSNCIVAFSEGQEFINRTYANINSMLRAAALDDPNAYVGNLL